MDITEATTKCNSLWPITKQLWQTRNPVIRVELTEKYRSVWNEVTGAGYKIRKTRLRDFEGSLKEIKFTPYISSRNNVDVVRLNMNPRGERTSDCTTRTLAYLLKGKMTYDEIRSQQTINALRFYGRQGGWNCVESYGKIFHDNGYVGYCLPNCKTRATLAKLLKSIEAPIATESGSHIAVIERGKIIDTWNSGGGHVTCIWAKPEDVARIKTILSL